IDLSDPDHVFWSSNVGAEIFKTPRAGGVTLLFHDAGDRAIFGLALDATHVYWTERTSDGRILRKLRSASPIDSPEILAADQGMPTGLALDATHVYWTNSATGTVHRMLKNGGTITELAAGQDAPSGL